jgi:hypothetical protein
MMHKYEFPLKYEIDSCRCCPMKFWVEDLDTVGGIYAEDEICCNLVNEYFVAKDRYIHPECPMRKVA